MQATLKRAPHSADNPVRLPSSPCYLLRFEEGFGLEWVAGVCRDWRLSDGRPALIPIALAAGVTGTHMFRLKKAPAMPPGNTTMAGLVKITAEAAGVSRRTAHERLFWFFDPADAGDVARLLAHLARVS